jgi:hypothetical protein
MKPDGGAVNTVNAADSANLLLKLYELRTEDTLRRARAWFAFEFHPRSTKDVIDTWLGPGHTSAPYRMAITYWDMAASLVVQGAIDAQMFNSANTEHVAFYVKLRPFLPELRAKTGDTTYLDNLERVVLAMPDAEKRMEILARYMQRQAGFAAEGKQVSTWSGVTAS